MNLKPFLLAAIFVCSVAWADQVTMTNGDRLTGNVVRYDGKNLVLKSELAGEVAIPWDAITSLAAAHPLYVGLKDGQVISGDINASNGEVHVGSVAAPRESVKFIRSPEEQATADRLANPGLTDLWVGFLDLGYATSRGNAKTSTFTLSGNATRATSRDKIEAHFTSIYSSSDVTGKLLATANAKRGGVSYNLNFHPRWFGFGAVDLENDEFQSLDLRFVPAGGLGYHAIKAERTILDFQLGAAYNRSFFADGTNRSSASMVTSEELVHKVNKSTSIHQLLTFYPEFPSYRINFDMSAVTAIRRWFSWQLTVSDRLLSNPLPGRRQNDILFTTGARLTFAK
jgi:putative salt-induced outer membrane protein YdiY